MSRGSLKMGGGRVDGFLIGVCVGGEGEGAGLVLVGKAVRRSRGM